MPSLGLRACACCDNPGRLQLELQPNALDDPARGTMLAANPDCVMHLATASAFAAALPRPRQAGSEPLGGPLRNGRVQMSARGRGAPSPSLGARGCATAANLIFYVMRRGAVVPAVVHIRRGRDLISMSCPRQHWRAVV